MRPILYAAGTTTFTGNGLGIMFDTISAEVTEERNGEFELALEYPVTGDLADKLVIGNLIAVKVGFDSRPNQGFEIYKVTKNLSGIIEVNAQHVTYKASQVFYHIYERGAHETVQQSLDRIFASDYKGCCSKNCVFTGTSDITTKDEMGWSLVSENGPHSLKSMLWPESSGETESGGFDVKEVQFNLLYTYGIKEADIVPNNYNIGINTPKEWGGLVFRYGVNIKDYTSELDASDTVNGIIGYVKWEDDYTNIRYTFCDTPIYPIGSSPVLNYELVDFSSEFDDPSTATSLAIYTLAKEYAEKQDYTGIPEANIQIDYVNGTGLEKACLLDKVKVIIPGLDVDVEETIVKVEFDVLNERVDKLELGKLKTYVIGG